MALQVTLFESLHVDSYSRLPMINLRQPLLRPPDTAQKIHNGPPGALENGAHVSFPIRPLQPEQQP